ncbi:MAG: hypothetical protein PHG66_00105 [Candidatus Colwellbacteria bacterium]|nr:hypothetical protein [Candidatus Colwellbacteria bacterium]
MSIFAEIIFESDCEEEKKEIKNKCEICNRRAVHNYEQKDYGIRCKNHLLPDMINLFTLEQSSQRFNKRIKALGGKVIGEYKGKDIPVDCICVNNHKCNPRPGCVQQGQGICKICAKNDSETSKQNFYNQIQALGGKVVGEYKGKDIPVDCICVNNHKCNPRPGCVRNGNGICRICANNDPETSKQNFYELIKELGGKVVGEYINSVLPIECLCSNNHVCNPSPNSIQRGNGICRICANNDLETSKQNFYDRIKEFGGNVVGEYINVMTPVKCLCSDNHVCNPRPNSIQRGNGMCNRCVQSGGEKFIIAVLRKLNIEFDTQTKNNILKGNLRYDFEFSYNECKYYLEFDGAQHFKFGEFMHKTPVKFEECRQRDLIKNYAAVECGIKMIRIAYNQISKTTVENFGLYLLDLMKRDIFIIIDSPLYNWIDQPFLEITKNKYLVI